jgi:hypothetical protein
VRDARAALSLARLALRERAPLWALLGAAAGALAAWSGIDGADPSSPERPRIALSWGVAAAQLAALLGAAILPSAGLAGDLAEGRAALLFARPLRRGSLALGRFLGGLGAAALGGAAALAGALLVATLLLGPASLGALAPCDEFAASFERLEVAAGEEAGWTFEPPPGLAGEEGAALRVRPRYMLHEGVPANRGGAIRLRVTPFRDGRALAPLEADLPTLGAALVPLPAEALAGASARLLLENRTEGSLLVLARGGLALRAPPGSLAAGALAAALGIVAAAAFVAAVATLGASVMNDRVAALLALTLALVASAPEELRGFARRAAERQARLAARAADAAGGGAGTEAAGGGEEAGIEAEGGAAAGRAGRGEGGGGEHDHEAAALRGVPTPLLRAADAAVSGLASVLPDLARADLAAPLLEGRTVGARALAGAAATPLAHVLAALLLAALLLARREAGLGRAEVT